MASVVTFIEREFILNQVMRGGLEVLLFATGKSVSTRLRQFDKTSMVLETKPADAARYRAWETVSVYLHYQGQRLTFPSKVRKVEGGKILLDLPERMLKAPQRRAVRVPPPRGLKLEFFLQNERVRIDCPEAQEYFDIEMPETREGFDVSSMNALLESFKAKADILYSKCGVVMFNKGRKPETIEERMIAQLGRVLLVTSTMSPLPAADPYPEGRIVTQTMSDAFEGPSIFLEGSDLERSRTAKAKNGVVSELFCPILYYQYVLGYIYVMNDSTRRSCLDFRAVDFAWEFARILAYNLKSHRYFTAAGHFDPDPYEPGVLDLSVGGCLLHLPRASFKVKLKLGAVIDLRISTGERKLSFKGRVARRTEDKENEYYGVAFINPEQESVDALKSALYAEGVQHSCDEVTYAPAPPGTVAE